jgi:uncharacterized membrane protein (DUF485 family)
MVGPQARIAVDPIRIEADPLFQDLVRERRRLGAIVSALMVAIYFGYILLLAFAPGLMRERVSSSITLGFPLGLGVLLATFALVAFYVWRSGTRFDPMVADIVARNQP